MNEKKFFVKHFKKTPRDIIITNVLFECLLGLKCLR